MARKINANYTNEFREQIAKSVINGKSTAQVAKEHGLTKSIVYIWATMYKRTGGFCNIDNRNHAEAELIKLRTENERLTEENNSLKQAFSITTAI